MCCATPTKPWPPSPPERRPRAERSSARRTPGGRFFVGGFAQAACPIADLATASWVGLQRCARVAGVVETTSKCCQGALMPKRFSPLFAATLSALICGVAVADPSSLTPPAPPHPGPPAIIVTGYLVEEHLTRDAIGGADRENWQKHFEFIKANTLNILAAGLQSPKTGGIYLTLVVRLVGNRPDPLLFLAQDPAIKSGLIEVIHIQPLILDPPYSGR